MRFEKQYADRLNFVVVNGDDPRNQELVRTFGVDGIPHLALIGQDRKLASTLVGSIPEGVVGSSLEALAAGRQVPFGTAESGPPN